MAANALNNLGNLVISQVINRMNFDAGALLALLVGDLPNVGINFVDGQAWSGFNVAAVLNLNGPLVACGKFNIVKRLGSVIRVRFIDQTPKLNGFIDA